MTRMTVFSAPKPFVAPRIATIQSNALGSWSRLEDVDILILGNAIGVAEAAQAIHAKHLPDVRTNASGTPLISSMLDLARQHAQSDLLCIINADMIAFNDLPATALAVRARMRQFLLLGRRWDLKVEEALDFSEGWEGRLRKRVTEVGTLHRPAGSDYFIFPSELYADVPEFAVGRAGWDNWMIFEARRRRMAVVDCTASALLVHQAHDYAHLPGGVPHYSLPETDENIRLAGGTAATRYTILDATHVFRSGRLRRPPISWARSMRAYELVLRRSLHFLPENLVEAVVRPKRWQKRWRRLTRGSTRDAQGPRG